MKKMILLIWASFIGSLAYSGTTTLSPSGTITTCTNGSVTLNITFTSTNNNTYSDVSHKIEIYKNGVLVNATPDMQAPFSPIDLSTNGLQVTLNNTNWGTGSYTIRVTAKAWAGPVVIASDNGLSAPVQVNFTIPMSVSFKINGLTGQYVTPCFTEPMTVTNFASSCATSNSTFFSIKETNGSWGPVIGTEKMEWINNANENGFDIKAWAASKGLPLQEGHYYTFSLAIGNPFTIYPISIYVKPTAPGLHVNAVQVTTANYPADVHNVCASALDVAFNAWSSTCEGQFFVEVSECQWNLVKTGLHEWNGWLNLAPGVDNVGVIPLANWTSMFSHACVPGGTTNCLGGSFICNPANPSGFVMNGGDLPGSLGQRFWRVTIATNETGWKTITALVRVNDGCLTLAGFETAKDGNHGTSNYHNMENEYDNSLNVSEESLTEFLQKFVPVENAVYPKYVLEIDKQQSAISFEHKIFPNPTNGAFSVELELFKDEDVKIELLNLNGQIIQTVLNNTTLIADKYTYSTNVSEMSKGVYLLRITTSSSIVTEKVVVE